MRLQHTASAWYSLESVLLGTHLLLRESQQKQIDDHLVWFAGTVVESKLSIDHVALTYKERDSPYMSWLSFCNSKTKCHCSENHSFSKHINMNDRLRTMKVVIENVRKFICVMKTKFLCLGNFHLPAQPTSRFHSIYPEYICCSRISEEALIAL